MSQIQWITSAGSLGKFAENEYLEILLDAVHSGGLYPLAYTLIAGKLSTGLQLTKAGMITGIPNVDVVVGVQEYTRQFTIRASAADGTICDRTFRITINAIAEPQIEPRNASLGLFMDGDYVNIQLLATDPTPSAVLEWSFLSGELPQGTTLGTNGKLTGYLEIYQSLADKDLLGWSVAPWDDLAWDSLTAGEYTHTYNFVVQVFDGSRFDHTNYTLTVRSRSITVDSTLISIDDAITIDTDASHRPFITTLPQELPTQRQLSNFAFQFRGRDLDNEEIHFGIESSSLPIEILLDPITGWLHGNLPTQTEVSKTYTFSIYCYKFFDPSIRSFPVIFTLTVLGDSKNIINWITPDIMDTIDNGSVSELKIVAESTLGKTLNYRLKESIHNPSNTDPSVAVVLYTPTARSRLPQGLKLLSSGLIVGRPSFEHFLLDGGTTTLDKDKMRFDNVYTFTVTASDQIGDNHSTETVSDDRTFSIKVNNYDIAPYENIYLRALPNKGQLAQFFSMINNTNIFSPELIYRAEDQWFGLAKDVKFLFAAGLKPSTAAEYLSAMQHNHYNKRIDLGNVKTAVALDANFNIKYEVIYVEVVDTQTENGKSPAMYFDRTNEVQPPYNTSPYLMVYPNSFENMKTELTMLPAPDPEHIVGYNPGVPYENIGALPSWMVSLQEDNKVLGFIQGIVIAYTVPGAAKKIAFRLQQYNMVFNYLDFIADRYQLDQFLSLTYDSATDHFLPSIETTFDRNVPNSGIVLDSTHATRFDGGATRFFNNQDEYADPETADQFIKFPKINVYY